mmetsp:Transcript_11144/g.32219  ORF Transcript_11144/g.32219 Transcript_11144/m.32219 type:complete len:207 (-) Transcript_11144:1660-2280(-)
MVCVCVCLCMSVPAHTLFSSIETKAWTDGRTDNMHTKRNDTTHTHSGRSIITTFMLPQSVGSLVSKVLDSKAKEAPPLLSLGLFRGIPGFLDDGVVVGHLRRETLARKGLHGARNRVRFDAGDGPAPARLHLGSGGWAFVSSTPPQVQPSAHRGHGLAEAVRKRSERLVRQFVDNGSGEATPLQVQHQSVLGPLVVHGGEVFRCID